MYEVVINYVMEIVNAIKALMTYFSTLFNKKDEETTDAA